MARYLTLAALLLCVPAAHADDKKLIIRWHGQSFFEMITTAGTRVVFDPHGIENYGKKSVMADLVLMSHLHNDHTYLDAVANGKKAKVLNALKKVEGDRQPEFNPIKEKFKDIQLQSLGTYHDAMSGLQRGKNGVFILDVDGLRIVHLGDLGHSRRSARSRWTS
jgi:L-ascorbate metabolism protein UlaG (beta-lactamase superfamily)